jgi:thioesterase domain-containing protein
VLSYTELARLLGPEQPFYGLQARGLEGEAPPCETIPEMAALYLSALKAVQPRGPYLLGGWSMGASIAWEMACQLQRQGERVEVLALIDGFVRPFDGGETPPDLAEALRFGALFYKDLLQAAGHALPLTDDALSRMAPEELLRTLEEASQSLATGSQPLQALRRVFELNLLAAWRYVPPPYAGPVLSIQAKGTTRVHGWEEVATGALKVHEIDGDHYSILRAPHVEPLASHLRNSLARDAGVT